MRKKVMAAVLAGVMAAGLLTGCKGSAPSGATRGEAGAAASEEGNKQPIRFLNNKIEIDRQLKDFAKKYQEETGQEVIVESLGGGVDINGQLKNYYAAGNMPDIFGFGPDAYGSFKDWLLDVSDMKCFQDTDYGFQGEDGRYYGIPFAIEGYGLAYNKDILDKAGVDPSKITNRNELRSAFETIDAKKTELGIQAVCSVAAESGQMYWAAGNHLMGVYLSQGVSRDDKTNINSLKAGVIDKARMGEFADYLKLLFDYSDKNILISGTYDDQLALWAQGKAAFITQGNWIDPSLPTYNASFSCGVMPAAFSVKDTDGILADAPSYWGIYKDGKNTRAAGAFVDALTTQTEGQKALVEDCGMVSPYKSCTLVPDAPLAKSILPYIKLGKTYAWDWCFQPEGIAQNATGAVFELYAKGQLDKDGFVDLMASTVADYLSSNGAN